MVNEADGVVVHRVTGSWFPNFVGTEQVRSFKLEGDKLLLTAETTGGSITVVWQKVDTGSRNFERTGALGRSETGNAVRPTD